MCTHRFASFRKEQPGGDKNGRATLSTNQVGRHGLCLAAGPLDLRTVPPPAPSAGGRRRSRASVTGPLPRYDQDPGRGVCLPGRVGVHPAGPDGGEAVRKGGRRRGGGNRRGIVGRREQRRMTVSPAEAIRRGPLIGTTTANRYSAATPKGSFGSAIPRETS